MQTLSTNPSSSSIDVQQRVSGDGLAKERNFEFWPGFKLGSTDCQSDAFTTEPLELVHHSSP